MASLPAMVQAGRVVVPLVIEMVRWLKNRKNGSIELTPQEQTELIVHLRNNVDVLVAGIEAWQAANPIPPEEGG